MKSSDNSIIQKLLSVDQKIAEEVLALSNHKEYPCCSIMSAQSSIDKRGMFLTQGAVKYSYITNAGNEIIFRISKAPIFIPYTLYGFFLGEESPTSCYSLTDVQGYEITSDKLVTLMEKYPQLSEFYTLIAQASIQLMQSKEISILEHSSAERYDNFVKSYAELTDEIALKDIANYLNIRPGSLSRIRKNRKVPLS